MSWFVIRGSWFVGKDRRIQRNCLPDPQERGRSPLTPTAPPTTARRLALLPLDGGWKRRGLRTSVFRLHELLLNRKRGCGPLHLAKLRAFLPCAAPRSA